MAFDPATAFWIGHLIWLSKTFVHPKSIRKLETLEVKPMRKFAVLATMYRGKYSDTYLDPVELENWAVSLLKKGQLRDQRCIQRSVSPPHRSSYVSYVQGIRLCEHP